ncbi:SDR family NAD(P)-dependent oxidoreductase [Enteractinococcus fodinae]|uniref:3alpha(Or 20beta)-hydroxysteroid dehydrogenase n=1 Tax=Enteractinococcus fodinae TaxID=684663 RepID=A0ABU2B6Q3_9MICC|nr:glucose 1-dehydrogenase [Enteractinococcus fodinae]MDR7348438.1 3alpha(or 20beta)-hydroxysteroid dehydrogenase [Enteractinococcus fodinae]
MQTKVEGRLAGKVVFVSGAASGMGAAHAKHLVSEGASVVIADIDEEGGRDLANIIDKDETMFFRLDVSDYDNWLEAIDKTVERFGRLDALVNNAGMGTTGSVEVETIDGWHETLGVNLHGSFYGMKAAVPQLKQSEAASIINISSIAGFSGFKDLVAYSTAKSALQGLTKSSALDLAQHGIRVNLVHPGSIETPLTADLQRGLGQIPLGRVGQPREVSSLIVYLVSKESSFVTGASFVIDGGETAGNNLRGSNAITRTDE